MSAEVIVFLGPTLPLERAREVLDATYRPPARQGDVFRALAERPRGLVLIDGVFEAVPSVWHHELRAALASGVFVLGASSMGALRAAELHRFGMVPIGPIAKAYAAGERIDDADVVLLHGDAESGYRPLTVPLVNVQATLAHAVTKRVLSAREARALHRLAAETFYKERTWRGLLAGVAGWRAARRAEVLAWVRASAVDQKALDAVEALQVARRLLDARAAERPKPLSLSSFVRRRRLVDVDQTRIDRLQARPDADELAARGTRRWLVAEFARLAGLVVTEEELADALQSIDDSGLSADDHRRLATLLALERLVTSRPERFVADGPSHLEARDFEARVRRPRSR